MRRASVAGAVARCTLVIALLLASATASAEGIYAQRWTDWATTHFRVHAHASVAPLGADVRDMMEQAYTVVTERFGWAPRGRVHVVIEDQTDSANGVASTAPWNDIRLYAVPPTHDSTLGYYDNWMWNLVVHEYTHIVHLDRVEGIPKLVNTLLEAELSPGHTIPRWFIEGLATWFESDVTGTGRLNSAYMDAYWRAAALDGTYPTMGDLSGSSIDWPFGTGWYLYGGHFIDTLVDRVGFDAVARYLDVYSRQVIPYRVDSLAKKVMGVSLIALWPEMHAEQAGRAHADALVSRILGGGAYERVTRGGNQSRFVTVDPDGALAWIEDDATESAAIVTSAFRVDLDASGEFDFLAPDRVVIDQPHQVSRYFSFRDLYELDLRTGSSRAITWGARAREPRVGPDNRRVAFSSVSVGRANIAVLDLDTGEVTQVFEAEAWGQATSPDWVDADHIVFSYLRPGHGRDLYVLDLREGAAVPLRQLTHDGAVAVDPFVVDGAVLFSSDRDGIHNLYAIPIDGGDTRRLTRVDTGAFSPVLAGDTLAFGVVGGAGFDIGQLRMASAPLDAPLAGPVTHPMRPVPPPAIDLAAVRATPERRRASIRAMRRPDWTPQLGLSGFSSAVGLQLASSDAPGVNAFDATLQWSFEHMQPVGYVGFTTRRLPIPIGLSVSRGLVVRDRSLVRASRYVPYLEQRIDASIGTTIIFPRLGSTHGLSFSYSANWHGILDEPEVAPSPVDITPQSPEYRRFNALRTSWGWSRVRRYGRSFTREEGTSVDVSFLLRSALIGAQVESGELTAGVAHYAELPWGHVLAMRASGGIADAATIGPRTFTLGGLGTHDVFLALYESAPEGTAHIRGYRPGIRSGNRFYRGQLEYRMPVANLGAGSGTLPVYLERLHAAVFLDTGDATSDRVRFREALVGMGAELRLSTVMGYSQAADFRLGFARGVGADGIWDAYLLYGFEY